MAKKQQIILLHGESQLTANTITDGKALLVNGETAVFNAEKAEDVEFYATAKDGSLATFQTAAKTNAAIKELADVLGSNSEGLVGKVAGLEAALGAGFSSAATVADAVEAANDRIDEISATTTTLVGNDAKMSAREIVQDEVAKQLTSENISESFDTLKEMAEWLSSHPADVQEMNDAIDALEAALGTGFTSAATVQSAIVNLQGQIDAIADEKDGTLAKALADAKAYTDSAETRSQAYADQAEADAKAYTDQKVSAATETLKTYADDAVASAMTEIDAYTVNGKAISSNPVLAAADVAIAEVKDEENVVLSGSVQDAFGQVVEVILENEKVHAAALNDLNTRLDAMVGEEGALAKALAEAKAYTDQEVSGATETLKAYADQAEADAKTYADDAVSAATETLKAYADQAEADAKTYADQKVGELDTAHKALLGTGVTTASTVTAQFSALDQRVATLETIIDGGTY
jgi:hypothetical protein